LDADGSIIHWGYRPAGAAPPDGTGFTAIAAGDWHSLAMVPEPSTYILCGIAFIGAGISAGYRRWRKSR
jgi:hypothetical protein